MPKTILFVEDDEDLREMIGFAIRSGSYEYYGAPSAEDALELMKTTMPDLFILDVMMPG